MARFTFGGEVTHIGVQEDATTAAFKRLAAGTAMPWRTTPGGAVVTDFLLWDGAAYTIAATSIVSDANGYAPPFQGPDGVSVLYDPSGYALVARDAAAGLSLGTAANANTGTTSGTVPVLGAGGLLALGRLGGGTPTNGTYVDGGSGVWTTLPTSGALTTVAISDLPAGVALFVRKSGATWPPRPSTLTDYLVFWVGQSPFPPVVTSGTAGMYAGDVAVVMP